MVVGTWTRPVDPPAENPSRWTPGWATLVIVLAALGSCVAAAGLLELLDGATAETLVGTAVLLVAAIAAERFPIPLEGTGAITLTFVFGISALILFGWGAAAVVFFLAPVAAHVGDRRHRGLQVAAAAAGALAAAAAGAAARTASDGGATSDLLTAFAWGTLTWFAAATALAAALELSDGALLPRLVRRVRATALPFALMASASLALVVLWQRSPVFSVALAGPLLAIVLYGRSTTRAVGAMRLALTDPLTGLGNHRHFQERLARGVAEAGERGTPVSLCLVDVDDFKCVNDRFGHPAGDRLLGQVAARLRHGGEAFRLGGDEFAVLLPGAGTSQALAAAEAIVARVAAIRGDDGYSVTVSAGVATYPSPGVMQDELVRAADTALYWAKEHGKNRVRAHRGEADDLRELRGEAVPADRAARHRAALSLARAVEARDALAGGHAERVSALAARIAVRLGLDPEEVELVRLAGSLHDVGKLGLPPELLRKDTPLTAAERAAVERHAQIGFRMLESLGLTAVALAVLHHHERWDGGGYPDGLARAEIPLAARILCVADAFDAMTAHATYRPTVDAEDALAELQRCAGTQFDPAVVAALRAEVAAAPEPALAV